MHVVLIRHADNLVSSFGSMDLFTDNEHNVFSCVTLEPPFIFNEKRISCIPCGNYIVKKRWSLKYGFHFHVLNVPDRSMILIHHGNFYTNTLGCIVVGSEFKDINNDAFNDVINSKATLKKLYALLPSHFTLSIKNDF